MTAGLADTFTAKLQAFSQKETLLVPGDRVLVAVSGGQDSLALLHALHRLAPEIQLTIMAAHLHHGIRGIAADEDERYLHEFCAGLQVPLFCGQVDVPALARKQKLSLETAGRKARYEFLKQVADENQCNRIATAHTATDCAETVLFNVLRGSGLNGLRGIPAKNENIVRPLLSHSREETAVYCAEYSIIPQVDASNFEPVYTRNRLRNLVIPVLVKEFGPGVEQALLRLAQIASAEVEWTDAVVEQVWLGLVEYQQKELNLNLSELQKLPTGLLARILRRSLFECCHDLEGFTAQHIDAVMQLVHCGRTGAQVHLPFDIIAQRGYNIISFYISPPKPAVAEWEVWLPVPGSIELPCGGRLVAEICIPPVDFRHTYKYEAWLDIGLVESLQIRNWQQGDRVKPIGMTGSKRLHDLFIDSHVPREERNRVPVVCIDDAIIWVGGLCTGRSAIVTPMTEFCIHLQWVNE